MNWEIVTESSPVKPAIKLTITSVCLGLAYLGWIWKLVPKGEASVVMIKDTLSFTVDVG